MRGIQFLFITLVLFFQIAALPLPAEELMAGKGSTVAGSMFGKGDGFSFAFDSKNRPAIVYMDREDGRLIFAAAKENTWEKTRLDDVVSKEGEEIQLGLSIDNRNQPHVSYGKGGALEYASMSDGKWSSEVVDSSANSGRWSSIAASAESGVSIAYESGGKIKLASKKPPGRWKVETLDSEGSLPDLTLVYGEEPFVAYLSGSVGLGAVKCAHLVDGRWTKIEVKESASSRSVSAKFLSKNRIGIAFSTDKAIEYLSMSAKDHSTGQRSTVDRPGANDVSLAYEKGNVPRLAYITSDRKELAIARWDGIFWDIKRVASARTGYSFDRCRAEESPAMEVFMGLRDRDSLNFIIPRTGGWAVSLVDGKERMASAIAMASDAHGAPAIVYFNETSRELRYSTRNASGAWESRTISNVDKGDCYSDIAFDGSGAPVVSFYETGERSLKCAFGQGGRWSVETIQTGKTLGRFHRVAIDARGSPAIAFQDKERGKICLASRAGANKWTIEDAGNCGVLGEGLDMGFMPDGAPVICYARAYIDKKAGPEESPLRTYVECAGKAGTGWNVEEVEGPFAMDVINSSVKMAIAKNGTIRLIYRDRDRHLRMAVLGGGKPEINTILTQAGPSFSIALTGRDEPAILYEEKTAQDTNALFILEMSGNTSKTYKIATAGRKPSSPVIGFDSKGLLRLAYCDLQFDNIVYFEEEKK